MISFANTLVHGLLICIPFTVFAVTTFWIKPRLWLHSLPLDIQKLVPPKSPNEERLTRFVMMPLVLGILPGLSVVSTIYTTHAQNTDLTLLGALVHLYGIWVIVHIWDFVVIDGSHAFFINPQNPPIHGTEGATGWNDYEFHFKALLKAVVMTAVFVVPAAIILSFLF